MKKIIFVLFMIPVFAFSQGRDYKGVTNSDTLKTPSSMATYGYTRSRLDSLIALILIRAKYTDTATMLNPYLIGLLNRVKYTDTTLMLSAYLTALIGKVNYTDTSGMLGPYFKTFQAASYKLKSDSGRVGGNYVTGASEKLIIDSLAAIIALKLTDPTRPPTGSYRFLAGNNTTNIYMTRTINNQDLAAGNVTLTKNDIGLTNVDNTPDASKPVSTLQQAALDLKLFITDTAGEQNAYRLADIANAAAILLKANISSVPSLVASIDATAQGANIGTATLYAVPSNGFYRVNIYITITRAATTSSTMPSTTITYTDGNAGTNAHSTVTTATAATNSVTTSFAQVSYVMYAKASTNIQYATASFATSGGTSMQYALRIRVEALL